MVTYIFLINISDVTHWAYANQNKTEQNKTKQIKIKQHETEQNKTEQNKTTQNKTKQKQKQKRKKKTKQKKKKTNDPKGFSVSKRVKWRLTRIWMLFPIQQSDTYNEVKCNKHVRPTRVLVIVRASKIRLFTTIVYVLHIHF